MYPDFERDLLLRSNAAGVVYKYINSAGKARTPLETGKFLTGQERVDWLIAVGASRGGFVLTYSENLLHYFFHKERVFLGHLRGG